MNYRIVSRFLGIVSLLIGVMMLFSVVFAFPALGKRNLLANEGLEFEGQGFAALIVSVLICVGLGLTLVRLAGKQVGQLYRKEAMAVVGLSWVLATLLGALPFWLSSVHRNAGIRLGEPDEPIYIFDFESNFMTRHWLEKPALDESTFRSLQVISDQNARGLANSDLQSAYQAASEKQKKKTGVGWPATDVEANLRQLNSTDPQWDAALWLPGEGSGPDSRIDNFRVRWVRLGIADGLFESQSGFSTTGATVISDLEDPYVIPHCILFWRSSTHFLGGLGIIVLFVVVLGHGSSGKALMRAEMPGPTKEGSTARMQHTAWQFAAMYCGLNVVLAIILMFLNMSMFDAICHAFGTMATGGFSTYNKSVKAFDSATVDYVITLFMTLAGTNFTLLYLILLRQPGKLLADVEWRVYMAIILMVTGLIVMLGLASNDFEGATFLARCMNALRFALFQVVAIVTTTGFGTHDFDQWNHFGRGILFMLMFVGGCAGSTGGGMKVIRHILFVKILRLEIEQAYHPTVVRPLRLGGRPVDDEDLRKQILVYFGLILVLFINSWIFVVATEPGTTWGQSVDHKLIDSATAIAATLNNIGPGLGIVGATQNYANFTWYNKTLFVWLMMIGRLEIFSIIVLFSPAFWKNR